MSVTRSRTPSLAGIAGGYAPLDSGLLIPIAYIPTGTGPTTIAKGTLLEQHTASASADVNFTSFITSSYDVYVFEFVNLRPATDNDNFFFRGMTGGTPTTDSGSNYWSGIFRNSSTGTAVTGNTPGSPGTSINLSGAGGVDNGTGSTVNGSLRLINPMSTVAGGRRISWQLGYVDNAGGSLNVVGHGGHLGTNAITGVNFLFGAGNTTSGTIYVYGMPK